MVKSAEDVILRKLEWYQQSGGVSDRPWNDILGILGTPGERLDRESLRYWAAELGVTDLLRAALDQPSL